MDMLTLRSQYPMYEDLSDGDLLMAFHEKYYSDMHPKVFLEQVNAPPNVHVTIDKFRDQWLEGVKKPMTGEDLAQQQRRLMGSAEGPTYTRPDRLGTAIRSGVQGLTFGGGDEAIAGAMSLLPGRDYDTELERERARLAAGREDYGGTALASEIAGAIAAPGAVVKAGGTKLANMGRGLAIGAGEGLTYGFLSGEGTFEDRLFNGLRDAAISGGLGAVTQPLIAAVRSGLDERAVQRAVKRLGKDMPEIDGDQLEAIAQQAFKAAEQDVPMPQQMLADTYTRIAQDERAAAAFEPFGGAPDTRRGSPAPNVARVLEDMEELATSPKAQQGIPFTELQRMRQRSQGGLPTTASGLERSAGAAVVDEIDDLVERGFPSGGGVARANSMWRRLSRHKDIQEAIRRAEVSATGFENGLRNEFRAIWKNKNKMRGYNATERALIKQIAEGTTLGNVMRRLSRLSPGSGGQHNVMGAIAGTGLGAGAGMMAGGVPGALAGAALTQGAGAVGEHFAQKSTRGLVDMLDLVVRSGIQIPEGLEGSALTNWLLETVASLARRAGPAGENSMQIWDQFQ